MSTATVQRSREIAATCTAFHVRRTSRVIQRLYDNALAPYDLRGTQFTLLNALAIAGEMSMNELADLLTMDRTTLTRNLRPLDGQGWVSLKNGAKDRRQRVVALTKEGRAVHRRALAGWQQAQQATIKALGINELRRLRETLDKLADNLTEDRSP